VLGLTKKLAPLSEKYTKIQLLRLMVGLFSPFKEFGVNVMFIDWFIDWFIDFDARIEMLRCCRCSCYGTFEFSVRA
jgi:hypothetical protein